MKGTRVKLEPNNGKDEDGKHNKQSNLHQRSQSFQNGFKHNLKAYFDKL